MNCYRFRADILDGRGDLEGAQEWYSKDALAKYTDALKYVPNWKQRKGAREAVVHQKI